VPFYKDAASTRLHCGETVSPAEKKSAPSTEKRHELSIDDYGLSSSVWRCAKI